MWEAHAGRRPILKQTHWFHPNLTKSETRGSMGGNMWAPKARFEAVGLKELLKSALKKTSLTSLKNQPLVPPLLCLGLIFALIVV